MIIVMLIIVDIIEIILNVMPIPPSMYRHTHINTQTWKNKTEPKYQKMTKKSFIIDCLTHTWSMLV